jgi:hypothetical protein
MSTVTPEDKASSSAARNSLGGAIAVLAILAASAIPFVRTYRGAPYVASAPRARKAVLDHCRALLRQQGSAVRSAGHPAISESAPPCLSDRFVSLVDLGSGSGELVFDAASIGLSARGLERNPVLVAWCLMRKWKNGIANADFLWRDMWEKGTVRSTDSIIIVFGVPGIMDRMADKLDDEMGPDAWLLSNTFEVPGWEKVRTSGGVHFYRKQVPSISAKGVAPS